MKAEMMKGKHRAFVFVDVAPGKDRRVLDKLLEYDEVVEAHVITGQYDVLAVLEFELYGKEVFASFQETASKFVVERIRRLKDVNDTNTIIPTLSLTKRTL